MVITNNFQSKQNNELEKIIVNVANGTGVNKPVFIKLLKVINEDVDNIHFHTILSGLPNNKNNEQISESEIMQEEKELKAGDEVVLVESGKGKENGNLISLIQTDNDDPSLNEIPDSTMTFVSIEHSLSNNETLGIESAGINIVKVERFDEETTENTSSDNIGESQEQIDSFNEWLDCNLQVLKNVEPEILMKILNPEGVEFLDLPESIDKGPNNSSLEIFYLNDPEDNINEVNMKVPDLNLSRDKAILGSPECLEEIPDINTVCLENELVEVVFDTNIFIDKEEIQKSSEVGFEESSMSKAYNHDGFYISNLNENERDNFLGFIRNKIEKLKPEPEKVPQSLFSRFCKFVLSCCEGEELEATDAFQIDEIEICPFIFELGEYLLTNGATTPGIFRCSAHTDYSKFYPFEVHSGKSYDPSNHQINDNAVLFKAYIREVLQGIFSNEIASNVLQAYKKAKKGNKPEEISAVVDVIQNFLPFALGEKKFELLGLVFRLFDKINTNGRKTEIDIRGLSIIFAPNIFPLDAFTDIQDYKIVPEIIELLYYADIERIHRKVFEDFLENKKLME